VPNDSAPPGGNLLKQHKPLPHCDCRASFLDRDTPCAIAHLSCEVAINSEGAKRRRKSRDISRRNDETALLLVDHTRNLTGLFTDVQNWSPRSEHSINLLGTMIPVALLRRLAK
jgi:hypothetical protein